MVTVNVGSTDEETKKDFSLHRDLLCEASDYFKNAFMKEFVEAQTGSIALDDVSTRTFGMFQGWLYSGRIVLPKDSTAHIDHTRPVKQKDGTSNPPDLRDLPPEEPKKETGTNDTSISPPSHPLKCPECGIASPGVGKMAHNAHRTDLHAVDWLDDLLDLFILADKYNVPLLRTEVMIESQHLDEQWYAMPGLEIIARAYDSLPETSQFCLYCVEMYNRYWASDESKVCVCAQEERREFYNSESMPKAFLFQLMHEALQLNRRAWSELVKRPFDWCRFHEHNGVEEIKACHVLRTREGRIGKDEKWAP